MDLIEPRIYVYSKSVGWFYAIALLIIAAIGVLAGLSSDMSVPKRMIGWVMAPLCIWGTYAAIKNTVKTNQNKPALIMDEKGIYVEDENITIPWDTITGVEVSFQDDNKMYIHRKGKTDISLFLIKYRGSSLIYNDLKRFCATYSPNPAEITFSRPTPETWPSEG